MVNCGICGCELPGKPVETFGDGYIEPREEIYFCPRCGTQYNYNQAYGWSVDTSSTDEDYQIILDSFDDDMEILDKMFD